MLKPVQVSSRRLQVSEFLMLKPVQVSSRRSQVSEFLMLKPVQVSSRDHRWVSSWCWSQYKCHHVVHRWVSSWCWSQYRCRHVITGVWVLDVEASTGVITWSQVSEFSMLKPVQVPSRDHRWVSSWCWSQYRCHHMITGEWVLDVEASTGVITLSQVSEFLILKPAQVSSRVQLSEQSSSEDDDIVLFAWSSAHLTGPFFVVLDFLYDVTCTDSSLDATGMISPSSRSGRNNGTRFIFPCLRFSTNIHCISKKSSFTLFIFMITLSNADRF